MVVSLMMASTNSHDSCISLMGRQRDRCSRNIVVKSVEAAEVNGKVSNLTKGHRRRDCLG
jgi:hypothetical protein